MRSDRVCKEIGCDGPVKGHGYCTKHYCRLRRAGFEFPKTKAPPGSTEAFARLAAKHEGPECLFWPHAAQSRDRGYGQAFFQGKGIPAHRLVCILAYGPPSNEGMEAAHSCRNGNKGCVSASHLRWATPQENQMDRIKDGTAPTGESNGRSIIKASDAVEIRRLYAETKISQREIGERFGIGQTTVSRIILERYWASPTVRSL